MVPAGVAVEPLLRAGHRSLVGDPTGHGRRARMLMIVRMLSLPLAVPGGRLADLCLCLRMLCSFARGWMLMVRMFAL